MPYASSGNAEIYYEVQGEGGPPVILIRGFGNTLLTWYGIDSDLARDHLIVVLDNRGVGRSSSPCGSYNMSTMADDVAAVIRAARLEPAHVLGTSLGGMIAQELAVRHSRLVRSMVLAATTAGGTVGIPLRRRSVLTLALSTVLPARLRSSVAGWATLSRQARRSRPELVGCRANGIRAGRTSLAGLVGQAGAVFTHQTGTRLRGVSIPTLVVHGEADRLIDRRNAEILAQLIPQSRLQLWPDCGHDLAAEVPQLLAQTVRQHIREVAAPGPHLRCSRM